MAGQTWTLDLPGSRPLTLNERLHWAARNRRAQEWRALAGWHARAQRVPRLNRAEVTLRITPPDRRRRDEDNLVPTLKHCVDGLVDAGVLADDTPEFVTSRVVLCGPDGTGNWRFVLVVTDMGGLA